MSRKMKMGSSRRLGWDNGENKTKTNNQSLALLEEKGIDVMGNVTQRKTEPISQDLVQFTVSLSENLEGHKTTKTKRKLGSTRRYRERQDVNELWSEEACGSRTEVCNDAAPSEVVSSEDVNSEATASEASHSEAVNREAKLSETVNNEASASEAVNTVAAQSEAINSELYSNASQFAEPYSHPELAEEHFPFLLKETKSNVTDTQISIDKNSPLSAHTESCSQIPSELLHQSEEVLSFCHQVIGPFDENAILHEANDFTAETQSIVNLEDVETDLNKHVELTFHERIILNPDEFDLSSLIGPVNQKHSECTSVDLSDTRNPSTNLTREESTECKEFSGNEKKGRYESCLVEDMSPKYIKRPHGQKEDADPFSYISHAEITGRIQDSGTGHFPSKIASLQTLQTDSYLCHQESTTAEHLPAAVILSENTEDCQKEEHVVGENNKDVIVDKGEVCHGKDRNTKVEHADEVTNNMEQALVTETWTGKEETEDPTRYLFTVEERVKESVAKVLTVSHEHTHEEAVTISDAHTDNIAYQPHEAKILLTNVHDVHVSEQSLDVNIADNGFSQTENAMNILLADFSDYRESSSLKLSLDSSLCNEETPCMTSKAAKKKRKMGSTRRPCRDVIMAENSEDWQQEEHINCEKSKDVIVGEGEVCHGEDRDTKVELSDCENGDKSKGGDVLTRSVTEGFDYSGNVSENQFNVFQCGSKASPSGDKTQPGEAVFNGAVNAAEYIDKFPNNSQTLSQYADCPMSFQSDDIPSTYSTISDGQHNPTPYEETLHQLTENLNFSSFPRLLGRAKEEVDVELNTSGRRKKMGSTRAKPKSRREEEHTGEERKDDATVPQTIPEVENSVRTGSTLSTENIEFRESTATLTEEERERQLRLVTDAKDKDLYVREQRKTDGTNYKEIEDSTNELYTAQEKRKPFGDIIMVEELHRILDSGVVNYRYSLSKDVDTTSREASHTLLSHSTLCHVESPHTITTRKKRKMGSTRNKLQEIHEEIKDNRKLKGDLTEPEDGYIGEQYKENDKATEHQFCHSTSIHDQEQTYDESLDIVGMVDKSQSKKSIVCFNKPSGVSVQLGQFENVLSHKPAGDQDLSQSHLECQANTKDLIPNVNLDPKITGKRTEKQEEVVVVKEMASGMGDGKHQVATNDDHVVQNLDLMNKFHQFEDFSNVSNNVENPQGKRKKMGSRRHGHGEFNNGNNRDEDWPGSIQRNKDDKLHLYNQTEDKDTEKVVPFEGNKTFLCHYDSGLSQEVQSAGFSGKTLPEQVEPTPVGAGNTRSSAEQVEKTCDEEEVKKRKQTRQYQANASTNPVPGQSRYNIVMVGNSNVGKTSFLKQFQSGEFCSDVCASVGIDTCTQSVIVDEKTVMLQLWDTAGQERFRSITRQVFHKAQAFLLMYDITSSQSFSDVRYWVNSIQDNAIDEVIILLLGNKADCAKRQVESHEGESLAKELNTYFTECSAATGENVQQSMEIVARLLKQKADEAEEGSMVLHKEPPVKKSSGCC